MQGGEGGGGSEGIGGKFLGSGGKLDGPGEGGEGSETRDKGLLDGSFMPREH